MVQGPVIEPPSDVPIGPSSVGVRTPIDEDPEFFHGLTMWSRRTVRGAHNGCPFAAQVRDHGLVLAFNGEDYEVDMQDARRLRDLLNVATARGLL